MTTRPVLILGGASDIGLAVAHRFARAGHPIQLAVRRPEEIETPGRDIALRYGVDASVHRFDALDLVAAERFWQDLAVMPGVVVCAVGLLGDQAEAERSPDLARLIVDTNLTGPTVALEAGARALAALGEPAVIVGISSVAGDRGRAVNYWYGAAKAGFTTALSGLRQKYARTNVRVITVKPGFVTTKMVDGLDIPPRLANTAEQIANLVHRSVGGRARVVYPLRWRIIMSIIRLLPERIFMRTRF